jgi:hypothetical protein
MASVGEVDHWRRSPRLKCGAWKTADEKRSHQEEWMAQTQHPYRPDYVPPPGRTLEEFIEDRELSVRETARRCGRSAKLIVEIIAGKAPIEPETAM